jgi:hypothetical protein
MRNLMFFGAALGVAGLEPQPDEAESVERPQIVAAE